MDPLRVKKSLFSTTLTDRQGHIRYTVETYHSADNTCPTSSVRSVAQQRSYLGDFPDFWLEEIASIIWRPRAIHLAFGRREVNVNTFLKPDRAFDNSRIFNGPENTLLRWKAKFSTLELRHEATGTLVARWRPSRNAFKFLRTNSQMSILDVHPLYANDPKFLDQIILTWAILDGMIYRKRSQY